MGFKTRQNGDIMVVDIVGRFDAYETDSLEKWFAENITPQRSRLVLNMKETNFIDSRGLATLVKGMKHCREQKGDLLLCEFSQPVQIIFELTRLDKAFSVYPTEQEAIANFGDQTKTGAR